MKVKSLHAEFYREGIENARYGRQEVAESQFRINSACSGAICQ